MHKCVNNTIGNIYHLEQMVDNFFPYSQKKLGFDKGATIVFQSDEENSSRMLGKTAYYNPESFEVVLYTDNRHPKDIMRSLSHELVHHAQNCRGDFTNSDSTYEGYAQKDPHLRSMEREAYTKGNLIFRDFEDLIKTGKINIEIDFSDSGEPKMSLKEWKNNQINTKLMKKWGLLREDSGAEERQHAKDNIANDKKHIKSLKGDMDADEKELEEGSCGDEHYQFDKRERDGELEENARELYSRGPDDRTQAYDGADEPTGDPVDGVDWGGDGLDPEDYTPAPPMGGGARGEEERKRLEAAIQDIVNRRTGRPEGTPLEEMFRKPSKQKSGKISVREAKQITRRIIERVKKEGK